MNTFTCSCCRVPHAITVRPTEFNGYAEQTLCRECIEHRGADDRMRTKRAEHHEALMRERWQEARAAATKMQQQRDGAFEARNGAVRVLERLRGLHGYVGTRGACACGARNCKTLDILEDRRVRRWIQKLRAHEYSRGDWGPDEENWEPYGIQPPRPNAGRRSGETA